MITDAIEIQPRIEPKILEREWRSLPYQPRRFQHYLTSRYCAIVELGALRARRSSLSIEGRARHRRGQSKTSRVTFFQRKSEVIATTFASSRAGRAPNCSNICIQDCRAVGLEPHNVRPSVGITSELFNLFIPKSCFQNYASLSYSRS